MNTSLLTSLKMLLVLLLCVLCLSNAHGQQSGDMPTIIYGNVNDASDYSFENKCFVLFLGRGKDAKRTSEEYVQLIEEKIFHGDRDIPIVYVLDPKVYGGVNAVTSCYINGKLQLIRNTKDYAMLLTELDNNADEFSLRYWLSRYGYEKVDLLNKVINAN